MASSIVIRNNQHFFDLTQQFDKANNTKTYATEMSLRQIFENFCIRNPLELMWHAKTIEEYGNKVISQKVNCIFYKNGVDDINWGDSRLTESDIAKVHGIYMMKLDILSGKSLTDPISVSAFPNGTHPMHPGGARMILGPAYNKKIPIVLTDYRNEDWQHLGFNSAENISFDFKDKSFIFLEESSGEEVVGVTYRESAQGEVLSYKQVQNVSEELIVYAHPSDVKKLERNFKLKNNRFYINNLLIAEFIDGLWCANLEEIYFKG